jgi:hypothetical protein
MMSVKNLARGLALGALAFGLTTSSAVSQNATNWHVMSNGGDVLYLGIGAGGTTIGPGDGIGTWVDGEDLRGNHKTSLGDWGYSQQGFAVVQCVLGAPPAISIQFPVMLFIEFDGRNANLQDVFIRPTCAAGGLPTGATTGGFLPYGLSPGASTNFALTLLPSGVGLPSSTVALIPNNGLIPASNGGSATIIAAASTALPINSTGYCWVVQFTWTPSALESFDKIDGWWVYLGNSTNGNQYWSISNDELNSFTSNTVYLDGGATNVIAFFASTEYEWQSTTTDPSTNHVVAPVGFNQSGIYYATTSYGPIGTFNPNGGGDLGRHGGVSLSGSGGAVNPSTGLGTQNPGATGFISTFGFQTWDNEVLSGVSGGVRTVWAQLDYYGLAGIGPESYFPGDGDVGVGPPGFSRLPISKNDVLAGILGIPAPWPQLETKQLFPLMLHDTSVAKADPDPNGFAVGTFGIQGHWDASGQLPLILLNPVCTIGLPIVVDYGSTGVKANLSDFQFNPTKSRISQSGSVTVVD